MSDNEIAMAAALRACIEGKRIVSADGDTLTLDDGMTLRLYESDSDCCASAWGEWVTHSGALEAIITDVRLEVTADREDNGDGATSKAVITILHNQNPIAQGDCEANDGNGGYYFSVLSLKVRTPDADVLDMQVVSA